MNIYLKNPGQQGTVTYDQNGITVNGEPTFNYAGKTLPIPGGGKSQPIQTDLSNNPSLVKLGTVELPRDVAIYLNCEKVIAESKILDGVSVYEHILRNPYEIEFEIVLRNRKQVYYVPVLSAYR